MRFLVILFCIGLNVFLLPIAIRQHNTFAEVFAVSALVFGLMYALRRRKA